MPVLGITHWRVKCDLNLPLSGEAAQQILSKQGLPLFIVS